MLSEFKKNKKKTPIPIAIGIQGVFYACGPKQHKFYHFRTHYSANNLSVNKS